MVRACCHNPRSEAIQQMMGKYAYDYAFQTPDHELIVQQEQQHSVRHCSCSSPPMRSRLQEVPPCQVCHDPNTPWGFIGSQKDVMRYVRVIDIIIISRLAARTRGLGLSGLWTTS